MIQPTDYRVSFTRTAHYNALGRGAVRPIMPQPIPDWVSFDADETEGLDLLGLRAPVQAIGNELFNGVTTVTPKLRYLSLISWIIWRYSQARLPDAWTPFEQFASAQEAAVVIANARSGVRKHHAASRCAERGKGRPGARRGRSRVIVD